MHKYSSAVNQDHSYHQWSDCEGMAFPSILDGECYSQLLWVDAREHGMKLQFKVTLARWNAL